MANIERIMESRLYLTNRWRFYNVLSLQLQTWSAIEWRKQTTTSGGIGHSILKSSLTREGLQPNIYHTWNRVQIITLSLIGAPTHDLSHLRRVLIITLSLSGAPTHDLSHLRRVTSPMLFSNSIRSTHKSTYLGLKQFYFLVLQRNWQFLDSPQ